MASHTCTTAMRLPYARLLTTPSAASATQRRTVTPPPAPAPSQTPLPQVHPRQAAPPAPPLTWDHYFRLRSRRRYINLGASIAAALAAVPSATPIILANELDSWLAQASGLDPLMAMGLLGMAFGGAGWLCGPTLGNLGFKLWAERRGLRAAMAEKERSFYARVRRYRADPAASSPQNQLPDYYGEKIASVKDYRRWLKDQRAFARRKNRAFV